MVENSNYFDPNLRRDIKKNKKIAIIPVGSIEQHGAHLPISTDSDIVTEIAKRIAEKRRFLLFPTITYGVSYEHAPFFHLSIKSSTLQYMLRDICDSLLANGIRTVLVINGHHGNLKPIKNLDKKLQERYQRKLKVFFISYWHFMEREFDHAGFVETSLMLAISKNVKMNLARKGLITDGMNQKKIKEIGRLAEKSFPKATKNGIWGDPTKATKKEGKKILAEIVENISKKVSNLPY